MKYAHARAAFVCVVFVAFGIGCGSAKPGVYANTGGDNGGSGTSGGPRKPTTGNADGGLTDGGFVSNDGGGPVNTGPHPEIEFLAPSPVTDPNGDTVLTGTSVTVRCKITRSSVSTASDVDKSSVVIIAKEADPMKPQVGGTVDTVGDDTYEATFDLSMMANGAVRFTCQASDFDKDVGSESIDSLLDLGPTIEIIAPRDGQILKSTSATHIQFKVKPAPLTASDTEQTVDKVTLRVAGVDFAVKPSSKDPTLYQQDVKFADQTLFPVSPSNALIVVQARDKRSPVPAVRQAQVAVDIDDKGPAIAFPTLTPLQLVRATVPLVVKITDPAGVDPSSVIATVNTREFKNWKIKDDSYSLTFDTRDFTATAIQLTIKIDADDKLANHTTQTIVVRMDNVAPVVSMDPPWVREFTRPDPSKATIICSEAFDPLGSAVGDLQTGLPAALFRVLVEDRTNIVLGAPTGYIAGVNPNSVRIYAQKDPSVPILIDNDGDGVCDEINTENLPSSAELTPLDLQPVAPRGSAFYNSAATFSEAENIPTAACTATTSTASPPGPLCEYTMNDMTRAIAQRIEGETVAAVYGYQPTNTITGECAGSVWSLLAVVGEGWHCLAARAEDTFAVGSPNVGVSRPIRVCFDDGVGPPACTVNDGNEPNCRKNNCAMPPDFGPNEVWLAH